MGEARCDVCKLAAFQMRKTRARWAVATLVLVGTAFIPIDGAGSAQTTSCTEPLREVFRTGSAFSIDSISAVAPDNVWATGESGAAYFVHWDGERWTEMAGPEPPSGPSYAMKALSGIPSGDVWAVGSRGYSDRARHVVLHWDGTEWSVEDTPAVGRQSMLSDVAVLDSGIVVAVGAYRPTGGKGLRPLVLVRDGSTWARERPDFRRNRFGISEIDGYSEDGLWAVARGKRFVLRRDANGWSKERMPREEAVLEDVAVIAEGSAWFVGEVGRRDSPLVWRRRSDGWRRFEVPDRRYPEYLYSVAANTDEQVVVAGMRLHGDRAHSYVAQMTEAGFEYVPAEGLLGFWDVDLDPAGGIWTGGEAGDAIIQRAC